MQLRVLQANCTTTTSHLKIPHTSPSSGCNGRRYQLARKVRAAVLPGKERWISIGWVLEAPVQEQLSRLHN
jgi:hypothetical protein